MNVFCVFERFAGYETLAGVCEDLGAAEVLVERRRIEALEENEPPSEWRIAEWPVLTRASHDG